MVTSGRAWREAREKGIELRFPSGNTAAVRPIGPDLFIRIGYIPDLLTPLVIKMINGDSYTMDIPVEEQLEKSKEWIAFLDSLVTQALVTPKVVSTPQADDEISIDDLSYNDKVFVYQFFSRPAAVLRQFHDKQQGIMASVVPVAVNEQPTEPDHADQPLGQGTDRAAGPVDSPSV